MNHDEIEVALERIENLVRYASEEFEDGPRNANPVIILELAKSARDELERIVVALSPPPTERADRPEDS